MKQKQSGFTLIEIAIVLVIIGLLLGGVLKGQELINSARVKNLAGDFKNIPVYIYGYQDKYRAIPGDDALAASHVTGASTASTPASAVLGNGKIEGKWDSDVTTDESFLFWQQIRLAGLANGSTNTADLSGYIARNSSGGRIGITNSTDMVINGAGTSKLKGGYIVCSEGILGKFAKQLDIAMDDGIGDTGSMMTIVGNASGATAVNNPDDATIYTVCMGI